MGVHQELTVLKMLNWKPIHLEHRPRHGWGGSARGVWKPWKPHGSVFKSCQELNGAGNGNELRKKQHRKNLTIWHAESHDLEVATFHRSWKGVCTATGQMAVMLFFFLPSVVSKNQQSLNAGFLLVSSWFHSRFPFDVVTLSEEFGHIKSDLRPLGTMMALFDAWRRCYELSRCHLDE